MREIVLDTETTGLDPADGHRLVEIGCLEILNHIPTGQVFHKYLNPDRDMPVEAFNVHGLSSDFLAGHARFDDVVEEFLAFIGDAWLVAHNAEFDLRFINAELARPQRPAIPMHRVRDTLAMARRRHPGQPNSLDALCARYGIDNSRRVRHGALLDAEILAEVYAELCGGRQSSLGLAITLGEAQLSALEGLRVRAVPLRPRLTPAEADAHAAFIATLGVPAIWDQYGAIGA